MDLPQRLQLHGSTFDDVAGTTPISTGYQEKWGDARYGRVGGCGHRDAAGRNWSACALPELSSDRGDKCNLVLGDVGRRTDRTRPGLAFFLRARASDGPAAI